MEKQTPVLYSVIWEHQWSFWLLESFGPLTAASERGRNGPSGGPGCSARSRLEQGVTGAGVIAPGVPASRRWDLPRILRVSVLAPLRLLQQRV